MKKCASNRVIYADLGCTLGAVDMVPRTMPAVAVPKPSNFYKVLIFNWLEADLHVEAVEARGIGIRKTITVEGVDTFS